MKNCDQGALNMGAECSHTPHQQAAQLSDQWYMKLRPGSCNRHIHLMVTVMIAHLSSHTSRFTCGLLGMRVVERRCPRPLTDRLFYRLCLRSLNYRYKDESGTSWDFGAVYQASTRPSTGVNTFLQPPSQNQVYRTNRGKSYALSKKLLLHVHGVTCHLSQNNSLR